MSCPNCGDATAWTRCWVCGWSVAETLDSTTSATPVKSPPDTRSEDQRKADAREAVQALGWTIWDHEQGYRPDRCKCGEKIPGGHSTRVPKGWPDWVLTGHGTVVFMEWKTDANDQTDSQKAVQAQMEADGVPYYVVRNTEQAVEALVTVQARRAA